MTSLPRLFMNIPVGGGGPGHMPARHQGLAPDHSGPRIPGLSYKSPDVQSRGELPWVQITRWTKMVDRNHLKTPTAAGSLGGAAVWRRPLAQGAILETWDQIPRRVHGACFSLCLCLCLSLSLCVTIINKFFNLFIYFIIINKLNFLNLI